MMLGGNRRKIGPTPWFMRAKGTHRLFKKMIRYCKGLKLLRTTRRASLTPRQGRGRAASLVGMLVIAEEMGRRCLTKISSEEGR